MKLRAIIFSLAILNSALAVTIPLASPRQIAASPLERGEVARVERGGYAELYVGGQTGPLRVTDGSALRGYRVRTLDPSEYSVSASSGFTHNIETGTYTATQTGQTNTIIITAKDGVTIEHVGIASEFTGEGLMPGEFTHVASEYNGNAYRWEAAFTSPLIFVTPSANTTSSTCASSSCITTTATVEKTGLTTRRISRYGWTAKRYASRKTIASRSR